MIPRPRPSRALLLIAVLIAALLVSACGSNNGDENAAGNSVDVAFIEGMTPHHESAIDMAEVAQKRSQSPFIKGLADDIVEAQKSEITVMEAIHHDLEEVKAADLGLDSHAMGMDGDMAELENAKPFDRAFIDMMIPHHQGAIEMARVELARGKSKALKNVAQDVLDGQSREIEAMNAYRKKTFGAASPAGGVPPAGELPPSGGTGRHSGH